MIEELTKNLNNDNYKIIDELSYLILECKITSREELKKIEENNFAFSQKTLADEEKIEYCINILNNCFYQYDYLDYDQIQIYKKLMLELKENISTDSKIEKLIILFSMTKKNMLFPYRAYNMIVNNIEGK